MTQDPVDGGSPATPPATPPALAPGAEPTGRPAAPKGAPAETGGPKGKEPTRYGDWEHKGRCIDF